jgi:NADH-quinone oxidoreductase subunit H
MFAYSAIAATLFLGGWYLPLGPHSGFLGNAIGVGALLTKMMLVAAIIFWVRFSYPRLREDHLQGFAWKLLIPLSLVNIVITAIFKVAF